MVNFCTATHYLTTFVNIFASVNCEFVHQTDNGFTVKDVALFNNTNPQHINMKIS